MLHSWDIATALDPAATIPDDAVALVVDTLGVIAGFAGKPTGADRTIVVRTTAPTCHFEITLRPDGVTFGPADPDTAVDVELPAEALIRLVYGRLDLTTRPPSTAPSPISRSSDACFPASEHPGIAIGATCSLPSSPTRLAGAAHTGFSGALTRRGLRRVQPARLSLDAVPGRDHRDGRPHLMPLRVEDADEMATVLGDERMCVHRWLSTVARRAPR